MRGSVLRFAQGVKFSIRLTRGNRGDGAQLRGTGSVVGPNGSRDVVTAKAERFFHDVSQYGGGPVAPSKISMMIIWPSRQARHCLRQ